MVFFWVCSLKKMYISKNGLMNSQRTEVLFRSNSLKKEPKKTLFLKKKKKQETTISQGIVLKKKYYLFRLSLPVTANILTRSQIAVNFLHSQRGIKFFSAINTHLMKHSIIWTSVPEHDNIITALNYIFLLQSS